MRYRENQRKKALAMRDSLFHDKGNGIFLGKEREFVLHDPTLNLWEGIREEALEYFKKHAIPWWQGRKSNPSGHLLSSQVACVNHLCFVRDKKDLATSILSAIDHEIVEAIIVDDGYLEFEFIGSKQYLMEKSWQRGANCTSVDAVMIGRNKSGQKKFFLIEWKYTEDYRIENKYIKQRAKVYDELIKDYLSPFKEIPVEAFYYEPFYQLMRQTLLAWKLIENKDHGCSDYDHIHVIPAENKELLQNITSPFLRGETIAKAWRSVLKNPKKYLTLSMEEFMEPCLRDSSCQLLAAYLKKRYW